MRKVLVGTAAAAAAVCALAACTSSGAGDPGPVGPETPTPAPRTTPHSAPPTGRGTSSAPAHPTTPARTSTSVAHPTSTPPSGPSSSSQVLPTPQFEKDPGVKLLRAWAAQVAHTITAGNYDDAALRKLMTPQMAADMKKLAGPEAGRIYPGPLPFTPISVVAPSPTVRDIHLCFVADGYSLSPKTHQPYPKRTVRAIDAQVDELGGTWKLAEFYTDTFSCQGVQIEEPSF